MSSLAWRFALKSLTEKKRHIFRNLFITFVPVVFLILITTVPQQQQTQYKDASGGTIQEDGLGEYVPGEFINKVFYTPKTALTETIIEEMRITLYMQDERVVPLNSEMDLEYELLDNAHICYGIIFQNVSDDGLLRYTLRTRNNNFRSDETYSRDVFNVYKKRDDEYVNSGVLAFQNAIDRAFLSYLANRTNNGKRKMEHVSLRYGHIPVDQSRGPHDSTNAYYTIIWCVASATFASVYLLLLPLVEERACGVSEHLKIACSASYWNEVTLFVISFIQFFFVFCMSFIYCLSVGVWEASLAEVSYLVLLEALFLVNLIAFTFFLSSTLESPTVAIGVAPVCLFVPVMLGHISQSLSVAFSVLPVNGFYAGGRIFISFKSSGHSMQAHDLYTSTYPSVDGLSLSSVYLLQIFGIFLWVFLWFYVTNVFPGRFGTPKSKCFFLSINYWRRVRGALTGANGMRQTNRVMAESRRELQQREPNGSDPDLGGDSISLEMAVPERIEELASGNHVEPLVRVTKLNKVYKGRWNVARSKVAVKDLSISIYSHNITVLLGHNGAGKTTTMNIMTGMVPRTSGSIVVDGEHDPNRYRQRIGFCPQHDVFYSYLNCREHLEFYGRLRGLSAEEVKREAKVVLKKVNLVDKSEHFVHTLSGGMKRRLSLAIAIIGYTKVLILDEPTSGLDPESRRDIWDLLLKLRKDHTILLTTHFMEEADILGDWIAIMEHGELVAFGTPLFLKQVYGKGYTLKLQKSPGFDTNKAIELVRQYVPNATVRDSVQEVFAVTLPYDSLDQYASLLGALEAEQHDLAIDAISMTNASLEEVFLNSSKSNKVMQHHQESEDRVDSPFKMPPTSSIMLKKPTSLLSYATLNTCGAIWRKKLIHMQCNKHIYSSLLLLPLLVTVLCFWITSGHTDVATALPAVTLNSFNIRHALGLIVINRSPEDGPVVPPSFSKEAILSGNAPPTVGGMELLVMENMSLEEALHELIEKDYTEYRDRLVVGIECNASMERLEMTILHNNNLLHSTGIGETVATALLLRYYLGLPEAMVEVRNIPSTRRLLIDNGTAYYFTELVSIAFMFYILIYMQVPLLEHQTGFRQLQNVNRYVYWASTYVFDVSIHILVCALVIVLAVELDRKDAFSSTMYLHIYFALLLYGVQALLIVYIISMCVQNSNTAITIMSYLMIVGVGGVFLLSSGYDDIKNNSFWIGLLHLVPEFALKQSMRVIYENQKLIVYENQSKPDVDYNGRKLSLHKLYAVPVIVVPLLVLILNEVVENIHRREKFSLAHYLLQSYTRRMCRAVLTCGSLRHRNRKASDTELQGVETSNPSGDETDGGLMSYVQEESDTVEKLLGDRSTQDERDKYAIVVNKLQKAYYDEHDAVKRISFAVKKGECFGLLGMNGAGKTTVFQMLSRNLPISAGEIYLQHCEVQQANALEYREQYGYCPQFDMLLEFMTVYQTVDYFARIKNIPARESHITHWLTVLDILAYRDHAIGECSGGTKRKVNTILALLGAPSVVLLDEPTTGVDPKSRRFLWKCIKAIQREDQTILLTSHSMDECEELCNRLSIMVDGSLRCIGSILQLKKRHGQDYTVLLKLSNALMMTEAAENYESFIRQVTVRLNATLREEHQGMVKFAVNPPFKLSELFEQVNELKIARGDDIVSYSINETSLEDIFMKFRPKTAEEC